MSTENTGPTTIHDLFASATPAAPPAALPEAQPAPIQPQPVVTPAPDQVPAVAPPMAPQGQPEPQPVRQVPLPELLEERRRRQEAERLALNYQQLIEAQQRQQQPQPQPIDPVVEPERAFAALQNQMHHMAIHTRANTSEMIVRQQLGNEVVDKAVEAARQAQLGEHFLTRPNPYGELIEWYRGQQVAREVGPDPAAYRAKVRAEERAAVLAELKAGAQPPRNLPPSLSQAANAAGSQDVIPETKDFFNQMMAPRKRG